MNQYFVVELQTLQPVEGKDYSKKVKEKYLVNSMSVTESEAKVLNWCPSNMSDPEVKGSTTSTVTQIFKHGEGELQFLARIADPIEDKNGKVKLSFFYVLINGTDLVTAAKNLQENFKGSVSDYVINSITETKIIVDEDLIDPNYKFVDRGESKNVMEN